MEQKLNRIQQQKSEQAELLTDIFPYKATRWPTGT